jgi:hypothetical protein
MSEIGIVRIRMRGLAALAIIGIAATITACGNATSSATQASAPTSAPASRPAARAATAAAIPAGDHRIGGAAQGISIEVPAAFTTIDLANPTLAQASLRRFGLTGASAATIAQEVPGLEKVHGVIAVAAASAAANRGFASNLNAYCGNAGTDLTGIAVAPEFKQLVRVDLQRLGAKNVTSIDRQIGGVPGVETSYQLQSPSVGTLYGAQLEVVAKPHKACFVTLTETQSPAEILSVAAASAEFY